MNELTHYASLLQEIKQRVSEAQTRAMLAINTELIRLYWDIGSLIAQRQQQEGWSAGIIPKLALDLKNELPEVKGFSERNLGRMVAFFVLILTRSHFCHSLWQKPAKAYKQPMAPQRL